MKKNINLFLVILWMIIIFLFSNQDITKSLNTSNKVIITGANIINKDYTNKNKNIIIEDYNYIVRKTAHFTLYFILGILVINCLKDYKINKIIFYSILICILYSVFDEFNQIFSIGRTANIFDVLLDSCSSIVSIIIYNQIKELNKYKKIKNIN